jgi:hypothetical protein
MRTTTRLLLAAACLVPAATLPAQQGSAQPSRLLCPEYAEPAVYAGGPASPGVLGRETFRPEFESPTAEGERLAQAVDDLFREAWETGSIQPRDMLNELVRATTVNVHDVRNRVHDEPWKERVTAGQVARVEHYRNALQALNRGTLPAGDLLRELRFTSLRVLLSCPATLRDRRVTVNGAVWWERSPHPPHGVTALWLEDDGLRVRLEWAGVGPVAEINLPLFERHPGVFSWWTVSISQMNGAPAVLLHDFLGSKGRDADEPADDR